MFLNDIDSDYAVVRGDVCNVYVHVPSIMSNFSCMWGGGCKGIVGKQEQYHVHPNEVDTSWERTKGAAIIGLSLGVSGWALLNSGWLVLTCCIILIGLVALTLSLPDPYRPSVVRKNRGCCDTPPRFLDDGSMDHPDNPDRVRRFLPLLNQSNCDSVDLVNTWWYMENDDGSTRVRKVNGACIFLNPPWHPRPGCSLWHAAVDEGIDPFESRPIECSLEPLVFLDIEDEPGSYALQLRTHSTGWFADATEFCTSLIEAYSSDSTVYADYQDPINGFLHYDPKARQGIALLFKRLERARLGTQETIGAPLTRSESP